MQHNRRAEDGSEQPPDAAQQAEDEQGAAEADGAFADQQRGVGRQRAETAVARGPAPEEAFGVAAVAKPRLFTGHGVIRADDAGGLGLAAEAGVTEGQCHVDARQRSGAPAGKAADGFQRRRAVEGGQDVGPAQFVCVVAGVAGGLSSVKSPHGSFGAVSQAGGDDFLAVVAVEHDGSHGRDLGIAEMPQRGVGPAGGDFDAAGQHMDDRRLAGGQGQVPALGQSGLSPGLEEPHLAGQLVGIVVRLGMDDDDFAVGRAVFEDGDQGIVQTGRVSQHGNNDRQAGHGSDS